MTECLAALAEAWRYATQLLVPELDKYDPVADGKGGFPIAPGKGGGTTKPGGHYQKIKDFQKGLRNRLKKVVEECQDDDDCDPPGLLIDWPLQLDDLANRFVTPPVIPPPPTTPVPVPSPAPYFPPPVLEPCPPPVHPWEPEASLGDWEYWEETTKLSGWALVTYIIISEGSRIVVPVRNLVPAP
jgi:hypothetical protein